MRHWLVNALKNEESDAFAEAVLRRFWAFAAPAAEGLRPGGRVIAFVPRPARGPSTPSKGG